MARVEDDEAYDDEELQGPDEDDVVDDDATETEPCPRCGRAVYVEAQRCPHCGEYISVDEPRGRFPLWIRVTGALALAALLIWMVMWLID